jgi:hypothetical protein
MWNVRSAVLLLITFVILGSFPLAAADVSLEWDPNGESDLAGYKVYFGTASGVYGAPITVAGTSPNPTYTVTGLLPGNTYYFAVTAYNTSGLESGYSNEVYTTIGSEGNRCDNNSDGSIDVMDLQALINYILAGSNPSSADINRDTYVNVLDLQLLSNVILGILGSCP